MKSCTKCGIEKSFDEFPPRKTSKDGFRNECKTCTKEAHKKWSDVNREAVRFKARTRALNYKYGMSHQDIILLLEKQNNQCCICSVDISKGHHVDHNHETGDVRGLLCGPCNRGLGYLKDSPDIVKNAYQYLIEKGHYGQQAI